MQTKKKYQRLQFYVLDVPILDETPYIVTKCTVLDWWTKFLWPEWFNLVLLTFSWVETNRAMSISDFLPFCLTLCECFAILALDGWKNEYLSIIFSLCWSSRRYEWKTVVYKSYDRNILIQYLYQISNWIVFEEKKYCTFGL